MKKRICSLFLTAALLLSLLPCTVSAEEPQVGGDTVPSSEYQVARGLWSSAVVWLLTSAASDLSAPYTLYVVPRVDTDGKPVNGSNKLSSTSDGGVSSVADAGGDVWNADWYPNVEKIVIAEGITQIETVFTSKKYWTGVKDVYLPEGLENLRTDGFKGCYNLETVHLPYMPENAPAAAFYPQYSLYWGTAYDVAQKDGKNGKYMSVDGILYSGDGKTLVRFPLRKSTSSFTVPTSVVEGTNVERIGSYAFGTGSPSGEYKDPDNRTLGISSLTIPATVQYVEDRIFGYSDRISQITFLNCEDPADIPSAQLTLDDNAFELCGTCYQRLTVTLPSHLKKLPQYFSIRGNSFYPFTLRFNLPAAQVREMENASSFFKSTIVDRDVAYYTQEDPNSTTYSRCRLIIYLSQAVNDVPTGGYDTNIWKANPVSFVLGGERFLPPNVTESDTDMLKYKPERGAFRGWSVQDSSSSGLSPVTQYDLGQPIAISTFTSDYNMVAVPRWFVKECKVKLDTNGHGTLAANKTTFSVEGGAGLGCTYGALPELSDPDYAFLGWYTEQTGGDKVESTTSTEGIKASQTLYAHWLEKNACVVTLHPGEDAQVTPDTLTFRTGETYQGLPIPTRPEYSFAGWFTGEAENEGEVAVADGDPLAVDGNHALHAHWKVAKPITLTCKMPDGTEQTIAAQYEGVYPTLPTPTREGYQFLGWTVSGGDGSYVKAGDPITVAESHTLEPAWERLPTKVSFDPGAGSLASGAAATVDIPVGGAYTDFPKLVSPGSGMVLMGWYTQPNGTGTQIQLNDPLFTEEDHTLYAYWKAQIYGEQLPDLSFSFANSLSGMGYSSPYRIPYDRYAMVFGDNAFARQYYESEPYWRGNCGGMVQAAAFFGLPGNEVDIANFKPDVIDSSHPAQYTSLSQLNPRSRQEDWNLNLSSFIEALQIYQIRGYDLYQSPTARTPQAVWDLVAAYEETGEHPVVAVLDRYGVAHAALCYMVREWTPTEGRIYIYDPNFPGDKLRYITVTRETPEGPYTQWEYMSFTRLAGYAMAGETPTWMDTLSDRAPSQSLDAELCLICVHMPNVIIYDAKGNKVAEVKNGKAEALVEDVTAVDLISDAENPDDPEQPAVTYLLASKGQYRFENSDSDSTDPLHVSMANINFGVSVETQSDSAVLAADDAVSLAFAKIEDDSAEYSIVLDSAETDDEENTVFSQGKVTGTTGADGATVAVANGTLSAKNTDPGTNGAVVSTRTFTEYVTDEDGQFNENWDPLPEGEKLQELPSNVGSYELGGKDEPTKPTEPDTPTPTPTPGQPGSSGGSNDSDDDDDYSGGSSGGSGRPSSSGKPGSSSGSSGKPAEAPAAKPSDPPSDGFLVSLAPLSSFSDCSTDAWYAQAVAWCVSHGLMQGFETGVFSPNAPLTRAQTAQILYKHSGSPAVPSSGSFADVPRSAWYYNPVTWAASQGLVQGHGNGSFDPDAPITREQFAIILFRAAGSPAVEEDLTRFTDYSAINFWARPALRWAVKQGLITGREENLLVPGDPINRAEAAAILMRWAQK